MKLAYLLIAGVFVVPAQIHTRVRSPHFVSEMQQVKPSAFVADHLRAVAERFSQRNSTSQFARLVIGTGPEVKDYCAKSGDHGGVDNYFFRLPVEYPMGIKTWQRLALVLKIGEWVVLRVLDGEQVQETVVTKPYSISPGAEYDYSILELAPLYDPPSSVGGVEVFVKARGSLKQADVDRFAQKLARLRPEFTFHVFVRRDSWFVNHPQFPFIYPFDGNSSLPTRQEYALRTELGTILRPPR